MRSSGKRQSWNPEIRILPIQSALFESSWKWMNHHQSRQPILLKFERGERINQSSSDLYYFIQGQLPSCFSVFPTFNVDYYVRWSNNKLKLQCKSACPILLLLRSTRTILKYPNWSKSCKKWCRKRRTMVINNFRYHHHHCSTHSYSDEYNNNDYCYILLDCWL